MSDKTGVPRPSRAGSGVILSGLAVGAILSTPVAAAGPSAAVTETVVTSTSGQLSAAPGTFSAAIREQFETSFTPGAVAAGETASTMIICES